MEPPPARPAPPLPRAPLPASGATRLRVRYGECDPMGVAHHAAYAPWLEIGRTEILRAAGVSYAQLEAAGVFLVVARLDIRFRRPAYYDDVLEVRTRVSGGGRVKIEHEYEVVLADDSARDARAPAARAPGDLLTTASSTLVCVDAQGRVQPLPDWLAPRGVV